jgi:hypothetical protein
MLIIKFYPLVEGLHRQRVFAVHAQFPVVQELSLVKVDPFTNHTYHPWRRSTFVDLNRGDIEKYFMLCILGMNMRPAVIPRVHVDTDTKEETNPWHLRYLRPASPSPAPLRSVCTSAS